MTGLEKMTAAILAEAEADAAALLQDTVVQCKAVVEKAVKTAEDAATETVEREKAQALAVRERATSAAALETRKTMLAAKREVIDEVFDRLVLYYMQLEHDEYVRFLASLAKFDKNGGELVFSARDKKLSGDVMALLDASLYTVSKETATEIKSGFLLKNGQAETNCSVSSFVEGYKKELEPVVAGILFAEE